jgi:Domain of unknown function (DUF4381)
MNDATSLDRLHDIVLPAPVAWWPPAPGWYAALALLSIGIGWLIWRRLANWRANAYRRAALRELQALRDAAAIAAVLRRTALAFAPRATIAAKTATEWTEWLDRHAPHAMPNEVRELLVSGIYRRPRDDQIDLLRDYTASWIAGHRRSLEFGD